MSISVIIQDGTAILRPDVNRFDASEAPGFKTIVEDTVAQDICDIKLDLSEVSFIDSSGLGAIVSAYKLLHKNGSLALYNVNQGVEEVFRLTGMNRIFDLSKTDNFDGRKNAA